MLFLFCCRDFDLISGLSPYNNSQNCGRKEHMAELIIVTILSFGLADQISFIHSNHETLIFAAGVAITWNILKNTRYIGAFIRIMLAMSVCVTISFMFIKRITANTIQLWICAAILLTFRLTAHNYHSNTTSGHSYTHAYRDDNSHAKSGSNNVKAPVITTRLITGVLKCAKPAPCHV